MVAKELNFKLYLIIIHINLKSMQLVTTVLNNTAMDYELYQIKCHCDAKAGFYISRIFESVIGCGLSPPGSGELLAM